MNFQDYQKSASRTLQCEMTPEQLISNLVFGLCGEAGEIADMLKKHLFHKHPLNVDDLKKELGDELWYLFMIAEYYHLDMTEIAQMNIDKLWKRYPNGFNHSDSRKRQDVHSAESI
jgi:NTP pyrophosphatase (non-canonical NTP hydrolase)